MSVVKIQITNWDGSETLDGVEYRLSYLVTTDDRDDGPAVVTAALPLSFDSTYASGNDADDRVVLTNVSVTQVDPGNFLNWNVDTVYKSTEIRKNPLLEPVQETVTWNGVEVPTNKFFNGAPILNTAKMPLDDRVMIVDNRPVVSYQVNQLVFPWALAQQVRNSVNSLAWKGFPPRTVKIQSMQTERVFDGRFGAGPLSVYYKVSYTFEINPETYNVNIDSMGLYELQEFPFRPAIPAGPNQRAVPARAAGWYPVPILEGSIPVKVPVGLDALGRKTTGLTAEGAEPIAIINGQVYQPLDYNTLFPFLV